MKELTELLNIFLDSNKVKDEENFFKFFKSWKDVINKIFDENESRDNIFKHTNIKDIKNDVLIIESDHSGWIQLLKTREKKILQMISNEYKITNIRNISFLLKKN